MTVELYWIRVVYVEHCGLGVELLSRYDDCAAEVKAHPSIRLSEQVETSFEKLRRDIQERFMHLRSPSAVSDLCFRGFHVPIDGEHRLLVM